MYTCIYKEAAHKYNNEVDYLPYFLLKKVVT